MVLVLCPSVLVLNLVVLLTSLQDALDRRRGELTRSAHPDAPHLARRGEPTPNTLSVEELVLPTPFVDFVVTPLARLGKHGFLDFKLGKV